jgi:hypothetical protein
MWEPRPLATLGASTACNRDIFTFFTVTSATKFSLFFFTLVGYTCILYSSRNFSYEMQSYVNTFINSVAAATRKRAGQPRDPVLISGISKIFSPLHRVKTGSEAHPVSLSMHTGTVSLVWNALPAFVYPHIMVIAKAMVRPSAVVSERIA